LPIHNKGKLLDILADPEVTRYHSMPTLTTLVEAHAVLERLQQRFAARDAIRGAIELVEHDEMIGTVGLHRFDFEHRRAELGYEIARRSWGQGLTPEAVAVVIRYGFSVMGLHRIDAGVLPGKTRQCGSSRSSDSLRRGQGETNCTPRDGSTASRGTGPPALLQQVHQ
jgi:GNAT acetyltransferase-like protein